MNTTPSVRQRSALFPLQLVMVLVVHGNVVIVSLVLGSAHPKDVKVVHDLVYLELAIVVVVDVLEQVMGLVLGDGCGVRRRDVRESRRRRL